MNRLLGVFLMVVVLWAVVLVLQVIQLKQQIRNDAGESASWSEALSSPEMRRAILSNQQTIASRLGFYGLLTVGVGVLILSGGIDLSIGSVIGVTAVLFGVMLEKEVPPWQAGVVVLSVAAFIGLLHGLFVTRVGLQPFLVTLCGLFVYRGLARWLSTGAVGLNPGAPEGFRARVNATRNLLVGDPWGVPQQLVLLVLISVLLGLFLHGTRYGRYLFAIGANEDAARYAGIPTQRYKVLAYVLCSLLAGLGGVLILFESRSVNATNVGSWMELYAITGAVLGGCSLRGGEGSVPGMFLGAAVLPLLRQLCSFGGISNELEYAVIGLALLAGTVVDELLKRRAARRTA